MTREPSVSAAELRRLLALARDLLQAPDARSVLELAGRVIQELLATDGALLLVALGHQEYLIEFDHRGYMQRAREGTALYRHARLAMDNRTPILLPEVAVEPGEWPDGFAAQGTASLLALPFPPVKPVGVLAALWYRRGRPHRLARQISTLRYIGELTGAALGNVDFRQVLEERLVARTEEIAQAARAHATELERRDEVQEELHRLATTDVMTGLLNRRGFFLHAERSLATARRQELPGALILADIDGLKAVNDRLGHDAGDRLIQHGARILRDSFRDSDVVARLGGDEFAVFTLEAATPEAILARIRKNVEAFRRDAAPPCPISFSTGIVRCDPSSKLSLSNYLSLADQRMYEHKQGRRR